MSFVEITDAFENKFGRRLSSPPQYISQLVDAKKWIPLHQKARKEYLATIENAAGFHKRTRIDRAERVYDRAVARGNLTAQLQAIDHQRREVEEEKIVFGGISLTLQQINLMSDEDIKHRKQELLSMLKTKEVVDVKPVEQEKKEK